MRGYLAEIRKKQNLTAGQVAARMGVSIAAYSRIENGKRQEDMRLSVLVRLADALNVPAIDLFSLETEYQAAKSKPA